MTFWQWLEGKKTYVVALLLLGAGILLKFDYINADTFALFLTVLTGGGFAALGARVTREADAVKQAVQQAPPTTVVMEQPTVVHVPPAPPGPPPIITP